MKARYRTYAKYFFAFTLMVFLWSGSLFMVSLSDLHSIRNLSDKAALLFGASSIALFVLSILIAAAAIVGWQALQNTIRSNVNKSVERATSKKVRILENELRGRVWTSLGYMVGEMGMNPDAPFEPLYRSRIEEAVSLCRIGYEYLRRVEDEKAEYLGLNNFVYYSCAVGDKSQNKFLLSRARKLMEVGQIHQAINLQLTACRVFIECGGDSQEVQDARSFLEALVENPDTFAREKREASAYLASLDRRNRNFQGQQGG